MYVKWYILVTAQKKYLRTSGKKKKQMGSDLKGCQSLRSQICGQEVKGRAVFHIKRWPPASLSHLGDKKKENE